MCVSSVQGTCILVGTHCNLVDILRSDYMCPLFVLLVLVGFYSIGSFVGYSNVCILK
jgi:hypothetical protein